MSKKILCDFPSQINSRKPRKNTSKVGERNTKHIFLHFSLLIITLLGVLGIESGLGRDWIARQTTHTNGPMLKSRSFFIYFWNCQDILDIITVRLSISWSTSSLQFVFVHNKWLKRSQMSLLSFLKKSQGVLKLYSSVNLSQGVENLFLNWEKNWQLGFYKQLAFPLYTI